MADKVVIVEIKYDTSEAVQSVVALNDVIEVQKTKQKALKENLEAGRISWTKYNEELIKSQAATTKANEQKKIEVKLLAAEKGSIDEIRGKIAQLTKERNSLGDATGKNSGKVKQLNAELDKQNRVLTSLSDAQTKQKRGIGAYGQSVEGAMKGIGAGMLAAAGPVALLTGVMNKLKDAFFETEAGAKFVKGWTEGLKTYFQSIIGGSTGMQASMNMAGALAIAKQMDEIRKGDRVDLVEIAKMEATIHDLRLKSVDASKSTAEQLDLIKQAEAEEKKLLDFKIADRQEELDAVKMMLVFRSEDTALLDRQAQLEAEIIGIRSEKSLRIAAKLNALSEKNAAEEKKRQEDKDKRDRDSEKAKIDGYKKDFEEREAAEQAAEDLDDLFFDNMDSNQKSQDEVRGQAILNYIALEDLRFAKAAENEEKLKKLHQEALDAALENMQKIVDATFEMGESRVGIVQDTFAKIATINFEELKSDKDKVAAIGSAATGLTDLIVAGQEKALNNLQADKEKELKFYEGNKTMQDAINRRYAKKELELKKKQFTQDKIKAVIDSTIATILAVIEAGVVTPMAIAAGILGGAGTAAIAAKRYEPSFAEGGMIIGGRSHADGGTHFAGSDGSRFVAEKSEALFVLKKDATAEIAALSAINESHGGRSWNQGASHLADGGQVQDQNLSRQVADEFQRTPIVVRVADIATGLTSVEKVKQAGVI